MNTMDYVRGHVFKLLGLKHLNVPYTNTFQQKIYLLYWLGVNLNFVTYHVGTYSYYYWGLHCPELWEYLYQEWNILKEIDYSKYPLRQKVIDEINIVNCFKQYKPDNIDVENWYKLLALFVYSSKTRNHSLKNIELTNSLFTKENIILANELLSKTEILGKIIN